MYLSDLIRPLVTQKLQETLVDKRVAICPIETYEKQIEIVVKSVEFKDDDGNCWIEFTDGKNNIYNLDGQGIDIYFEILLN